MKQAEHQANVEIPAFLQSKASHERLRDLPFIRSVVQGGGDDAKRCVVTRKSVLLLAPGSYGQKWSHLYIRRDIAELWDRPALNTAT